MASTGQQTQEGVQWLKAVAGLLIAVLLGVAYLLLDTPKQAHGLRALALGIIPGAIVLVLAGPIVYYGLQRRGLGKGMQTPEEGDRDLSAEALAQKIVDGVAELPAYTEPMATAAPEVRRFYPSFRKIDWEEIIGEADSLDIIVVYFDSWVDNNREELLAIFRRGGAIRLYITDPDADVAMQATNERFPEHSRDDLSERVRGTAQKLHALWKESASYHAHLEVHLYPGVLNYAAVRADEDQVLLSVYEHHRQRRIDSPAMLLDLRQSSAMRDFWDKELRHLLERSRLAEPGFLGSGEGQAA